MVRMTAAKRRFSAHLFKAEKLCWCNVLEASLPQSVLTHSQLPPSGGAKCLPLWGRWMQGGKPVGLPVGI